MARISIHIEAESTGDLHAELEHLLRGNRYGRQAANDLGADNVVLTQVNLQTNDDGTIERATDDRRAETVEQIQSGDDLKPVRGKNADDLAAKLIAHHGVLDSEAWAAERARLPKKHQEQVDAAVALPKVGSQEGATVVLDGAAASTGPTYKLVGAMGATIAVFDEPDQFVSLLKDTAAKLGRRSDIVGLAAANSAVVKTLPATGQATLEAAFRAALEAAIDDAGPATETKPAAEPAGEAAKAPTIDDVRAAVTEIANKLGMEAGREVVVETGKAAKISEIDASDYQAVLDECARLKAG